MISISRGAACPVAPPGPDDPGGAAGGAGRPVTTARTSLSGAGGPTCSLPAARPAWRPAGICCAAATSPVSSSSSRRTCCLWRQQRDGAPRISRGRPAGHPGAPYLRNPRAAPEPAAVREHYCKRALQYASITSDASSHASALISLASTYFYASDPLQAAAVYEQAFSHGTALPALQRSRVYAELAVVYGQLGREQDAIRAAGQAGSCTPTTPRTTPVSCTPNSLRRR